MAEIWEASILRDDYYSAQIMFVIFIIFLATMIIICTWLFYPAFVWTKGFSPWEPIYNGPSEYWYWKAAFPGYFHNWYDLLVKSAEARKRGLAQAKKNYIGLDAQEVEIMNQVHQLKMEVAEVTGEVSRRSGASRSSVARCRSAKRSIHFALPVDIGSIMPPSPRWSSAPNSARDGASDQPANSGQLSESSPTRSSSRRSQRSSISGGVAAGGKEIELIRQRSNRLKKPVSDSCGRLSTRAVDDASRRSGGRHRSVTLHAADDDAFLESVQSLRDHQRAERRITELQTRRSETQGLMPPALTAADTNANVGLAKSDGDSSDLAEVKVDCSEQSMSTATLARVSAVSPQDTTETEESPTLTPASVAVVPRLDLPRAEVDTAPERKRRLGRDWLPLPSFSGHSSLALTRDERLAGAKILSLAKSQGWARRAKERARLAGLDVSDPSQTISGALLRADEIDGMTFIQREQGHLREALQLEQRTFYGVEREGSTMRIGVLRSVGRSSRDVRVRLRTTDGTALAGIDFTAPEETVLLRRGETSGFFTMKLHKNTRWCAMAGAWQSQRAFEVSLEAVNADDGSAADVGANSVAKVRIVTTAEWPCEGASSMGARERYFRFAKAIVVGNFSREFWWLVNNVFAAFDKALIQPLLLLYLIDHIYGTNAYGFSLLLATIKLAVAGLRHYMGQFLTTAYPIEWLKTLVWITSKWNSLPLDEARRLSRRFQNAADMLDKEFARHAYDTLGRFVIQLLNLLALGIAAPVLYYPLPLMYFSLVVVFCSALFLVLGLFVVKNTYEFAHVGEWHNNSMYISLRDRFFTEGQLERSFGTGDDEAQTLVLAHRWRKIRQDEKWYLRHNQTGYIGWCVVIMTITLFLSAPSMVDNWSLSPGEITAMFANLNTLGTTLASLATIKEELKCAWWTVDMFAKLMNTSVSSALAPAEHSARISASRSSLAQQQQQQQQQKQQQQQPQQPSLKPSHGMSEVLLCDVVVCAGPFAATCTGGFCLDGLYCVPPTLSHRLLLDAMGGLRTPSEGAILMPPSVTVQVVSSDVGVASHERTLLDSLTCGVGSSRKAHLEVDGIWLLCRQLGMHEAIFSGETCANMRMHEVSPLLSPLDLQLIGLVRAMLSVPDVLLVQELSGTDEGRMKAVHAVLRKFVLGCTAYGRLTADDHKRNHPVRTVVWMGDQKQLSELGVPQLPGVQCSGVDVDPEAVRPKVSADLTICPGAPPVARAHSSRLDLDVDGELPAHAFGGSHGVVAAS